MSMNYCGDNTYGGIYINFHGKFTWFKKSLLFGTNGLIWGFLQDVWMD